LREFIQLQREDAMKLIRRGAGLALTFAAVCTLTFAAPVAQAQDWPQRSVRLILPLGPGSGADIAARLLSEHLSKVWGQPVVVENRAGGDGVIAINTVLTARDDHVLMYGPASSFVGHPYTLDNIPYNPKDLVPIARATSTLVAVGVPPALNVGTLKEMIDLVRAQPGKLNWTTITGVTDIIVAGYLRAAGLDMARAPYKNPVQALTDVTGNRIQFYVAALAIVQAQAQAGRIKLLAVTNSQRAPAAPELPTVAEAGFPELTFDGLVGFFGSPVVPEAARTRIVSDLKTALAAPEINKRLVATGQLVQPGDAAAFTAAIKQQADALAATAKILGIKPKQ
jgi:tripartite-type tricarboxylate transporter receptor subunit TctC